MFDTSNGSALPLIGRVPWLVERPPLEVGETSDEDAVGCLRRGGVDQELAEVVVRGVTGGSPDVLSDLVSSRRGDAEYDDTLRVLN